MDKLSQIVSQYILEVRFEDLGPTVIASAKRSTLDTIGAMLAGSSASGIDTVVDLAKGWGGAEEACVVGFGSRVPAPVAAWCNGAMARAREIDDCLDFLPVHPSASTVPALLALAEWKGSMSGRDFLTGLAVGQDLTIRMGLSLRRNGLQSGRNNMFRIFGSTAALAKAMGSEAEEVRNALGVAFSFAVGDGQSALDGALTLRLQQGIAAQGAVLSMLLASRGFTGAHDFLLGKFGYFRAFEPNPRVEYLTKDLGKSFYGDQISIKPYSACRAAHSAINLALRIRSEEHVDPRSITRVVVRTCPEVYRLVGSPRYAKIKPASPAVAQFSIQFGVAAAFIRGDFFLDELEPHVIRDEAILDLARRVYVKSEPSLRTDSVLGRTIMEVEFAGVPSVMKEILWPLGNPSHPIASRACEEKFRKCARYSVSSLETGRLNDLIAMISQLEDLSDVSAISPLLCSQGHGGGERRQ
jgi:2-methylcitrate dehydratase PrpD